MDSEKDPSPVTQSSSRLENLLTPRWCRYDPENPPKFSVAQNLLFAFAGAFTVANLYYPIAILNVIAKDFDVPYLTVSRIPTLAQSGYAVGLFFICPLGDLFPRRPYTLVLIFFTATLWIGLCLTKDFNAFLGITFITSITTVTPQIMLPLVGEMAPQNKKPLALSIVVSGNLLGIVIARILSGVVTNYTGWRNIYWIALGLQYGILIALFLFMPAYPSTNPLPPQKRFRAFLKEYPKLLYSILSLSFKHPVLIQAGLISYCTSVSFTCFWTTLTFLLASPPYNLAPTPIGLFGLIGVAGIVLGPLYAKYLIQPLKVPLYAVLVGEAINLVGCCIGTYTGTFFIGGPVIQALGLDAGLQITQIANRTAIYAVAPKARNRVNTVFMLFTFLGQITGTAAGNEIYERHGGWRSSGSLAVGIVAFAFLVVAARGPWEPGWVGWTGGWGGKDKQATTQDEGTSDPEKIPDSDRQTDVESAAPDKPDAAKDTSLQTPRTDLTDPIKRDKSSALTRMASHGSDGQHTF